MATFIIASIAILLLIHNIYLHNKLIFEDAKKRTVIKSLVESLNESAQVKANMTKQLSHEETQEMTAQGYSIEEIARLRKISLKTVKNHLRK